VLRPQDVLLGHGSGVGARAAHLPHGGRGEGPRAEQEGGGGRGGRVDVRGQLPGGGCQPAMLSSPCHPDCLQASAQRLRDSRPSATGRT